MLLGVFGGKGGGREAPNFFKGIRWNFFGVSRDLLSSFVHMYVMYVCMYLGLGVSN